MRSEGLCAPIRDGGVQKVTECRQLLVYRAVAITSQNHVTA